METFHSFALFNKLYQRYNHKPQHGDSDKQITTISINFTEVGSHRYHGIPEQKSYFPLSLLLIMCLMKAGFLYPFWSLRYDAKALVA